MNKTIKAYIYRGEKYYIGECVEISVVTQGRTVDETISNLREAISLHLEGENLEELGLSPEPNLLIIMEEPISVA
jgi:predicted RNase H-like HicB family nuclease